MVSTRSLPPWAAGGTLLNSIEGSDFSLPDRQPNNVTQTTIVRHSAIASRPAAERHVPEYDIYSVLVRILSLARERYPLPAAAIRLKTSQTESLDF
jgi:hypothetical protein